MEEHTDRRGRTLSKATTIPINKWDKADRPREKLLKLGPGVLSEAELIAVLLGKGGRTGTGSLSALHLARRLLQSVPNLVGLSRLLPQAYLRIKGIGEAKAAQLAAAFELGRRIEAAPEDPRIQVRSPEDVARVFGPRLRDRSQEVFMLVLLNTANVITGDFIISEGGLAASIVEPRAVFQKAILNNAAAIICLHNHPSGNPEPSREDIRITHQLVEAGKLLGIPVHDHLIIAGKTYTSLAERGLMNLS